MDQKEKDLEANLIEIAKEIRPAWAVYGRIELYTTTPGMWVCHTPQFRAIGKTPTEAVNKLLLKIKEAKS